MNRIGYFYITGLLILSKASLSQLVNQYPQTVVGLKLHYGTVYIHTPSVKNIAGSRPYGGEIEFSKQASDSNAYNKCNCLARNGVAVSYFNFDNHILGTGIMLSYFIEPSYRLSNNLKFNLRGAAGLTYASNPYDYLKNPDNKNYTTHTNPYLQIGAGLGYNLTQHLSLTLMGSLQHFSNGGFREPNRGLNWFTGSVGFLYYSQNNFFPRYSKSHYNFWKLKKSSTDVGILFVPKQGYNSKTMEQRKFIAGAFVQYTKQYGKISAITAGTEIYYDRLISPGLNNEITRPVAGIHAGHAFLLGRVSFSQQAGLHVYNKTPGVNILYFRYGLSYRITNHFLAGISLKTHADNADFTDIRVIYRF